MHYKIGRILTILLIIYAIFFVLGGVFAPILAHYKNFEAAGLLYSIFRRSCHQDAIRCFWIMGYQMAICARCLGAYLGFILILFQSLFYKKEVNKIVVYGFGLIAFGEIFIELFGFAGNNYLRLFAGGFIRSIFRICFYKIIRKSGKEEN